MRNTIFTNISIVEFIRHLSYRMNSMVLSSVIYSIIILALAFCLFISNIHAQSDFDSDRVSLVTPSIAQELEEEIVKATEFAIPPSPAFVMLDVTPSKIVKPGLPRAFKVDWSLKDYSIAPNLALEAQPIWLLLFNRRNIRAYQQASSLMRMLSTLTVSLGTVARNETTTWVGYGGKINLIRSEDPLFDKTLLDSLDVIYKTGKKERYEQINELKIQRSTLPRDTAYQTAYNDMSLQLEELQEELIVLEVSRKKAVDELRKEYINQNWNASYFDIAYGNRFTTHNILDSLSASSTRSSVWANGSYGLGKNFLLSSMLQLTRDKEQDFNQFMIGANIRYGNGRYNFFVEAFTEKTIFSEETINDFYLAYGGEFYLNKNIILDYALRVRNVKELGFKDFIPVVNIRCLMR